MTRATVGACLLLGILSSGCATRGSVRQVAADVTAVRAEALRYGDAQRLATRKWQIGIFHSSTGRRLTNQQSFLVGAQSNGEFEVELLMR